MDRKVESSRNVCNKVTKGQILSRKRDTAIAVRRAGFGSGSFGSFAGNSYGARRSKDPRIRADRCRPRGRGALLLVSGERPGTNSRETRRDAFPSRASTHYSNLGHSNHYSTPPSTKSERARNASSATRDTRRARRRRRVACYLSRVQTRATRASARACSTSRASISETFVARAVTRER